MTRSTRQRRLPRIGQPFLLSESGFETTLIFQEGWTLPSFATFTLLESEDGRSALRRQYDKHLEIAARHGRGFLLDTATWRANPAWGPRLGYDLASLEDANRRAVRFVEDIRASYEHRCGMIAISGSVGPMGDGYDPGSGTTADIAERHHAWQIAILDDAGVDLVTAYTLTSIAEGLGFARAACRLGVPAAISFTLETDGHLPTGEPFADAIATIDAATGASPLFYMINCAHPSHFDHILAEGAPWLRRIGGIRANASRMSHRELDSATALDSGDPAELGGLYADLLRRLPHLAVVGGCCGTDHRHISAIGEACCGAERGR